MPEVGVVIPCFNQARFLGEALESVAWQTVQPLFVIVVDDCSPGEEEFVDITSAVVNCPGETPYLIRHSENKGPSAARNTGIKFLIDRGCDIILPLDADDLLEPEMIEAGLEVLEEVDIAYPDVIYFGKYRGVSRHPRRDPEELARIILQRNEMVSCSLFRAEVWQAVKERNGTGYDPELHKEEHYGWEDWLFWIEAHLLGFRALAIGRGLFRYRIQENMNVDKANRNAPQVWAYFQEKIEGLYGVELEARHGIQR